MLLMAILQVIEKRRTKSLHEATHRANDDDDDTKLLPLVQDFVSRPVDRANASWPSLRHSDLLLKLSQNR